jgi:hypothetical protein
VSSRIWAGKRKIRLVVDATAHARQETVPGHFSKSAVYVTTSVEESERPSGAVNRVRHSAQAVGRQPHRSARLQTAAPGTSWGLVLESWVGKFFGRRPGRRRIRRREPQNLCQQPTNPCLVPGVRSPVLPEELNRPIGEPLLLGLSVRRQVQHPFAQGQFSERPAVAAVVPMEAPSSFSVRHYFLCIGFRKLDRPA